MRVFISSPLNPGRFYYIVSDNQMVEIDVQMDYMHYLKETSLEWTRVRVGFLNKDEIKMSDVRYKKILQKYVDLIVKLTLNDAREFLKEKL
jgi:hypothetical protein